MTDEGVRGILACVANELMNGYREHLLLDRNLSENSIRAYTADLESLLEHINKLGITEFKDLTIDHLRSWLANLQTRGAARSSLSRRVVSIKAFTYWGAKMVGYQVISANFCRHLNHNARSQIFSTLKVPSQRLMHWQLE
ncbi:MAG: hypothetical protein EBQ63_06145 [Actinobacteria bacterium]|nr:hypothetical protein [Actinomycetota bacterium]